MRKTFNLKSYMKHAFYEDVRGYMMKQERAWMDEYKSRVEKGLSPQEVWDSCLKDYNEQGLQKVDKK